MENFIFCALLFNQCLRNVMTPFLEPFINFCEAVKTVFIYIFLYIVLRFKGVEQLYWWDSRKIVNLISFYWTKRVISYFPIKRNIQNKV